MKRDHRRDLKKLGKRYVLFFNFGVVESENHFILECDAFKHVKDSYGSMVASIQWQWYCLFSEGLVRRLGQPIINLSRKMIELQKTKNKETDTPIHYSESGKP